ncbi:MAG: hypothetical protein HXY40_15805 [Chloroflexi bacterium]|nr:hypothetical protein [Chloroflexota bacterium]
MAYLKILCVIALLLLVACAGNSGEPLVFDPQNVIVPSNSALLTTLLTLGGGEITQSALSPDGRTLAVATTLGVWLYDGEAFVTRQPLPRARLLEGLNSRALALAFSPDSAWLASGGDDGRVYVWDVASGQPIGAPIEHGLRVVALTFSPNMTVLASAGSDNRVRLWDMTPQADTFGLEATSPLLHGDQVTSLAFNPLLSAENTLLLAAGSIDRTVTLWTLNADGVLRGEPQILRGFTGSVLSLAFSPDGGWLASGHQDFEANDNAIHLWDMTTRTEVGVLRGHTEGVHSVAFSPNGFMLISTSADGTLRQWNVGQQRELRTIDRRSGPVWSAQFTPDNRFFVSGAADGTVRLWTTQDGAALNALRDFSGAVFSVAFSPDGNLLATGSQDNAVHLWDLREGVEVATLRGHFEPILTVAFSPDGRRLASGSRDQTILLWEVDAALRGVDLRPCDQTTVYAGLSPEAQRAHPCNGVQVLEGHRDDVRSVVFSPDSRMLASASCVRPSTGACQQGEIRLWDLTMNGLLAVLQPPIDNVGRGVVDETVNRLVFSPDGSVLASANRDETVNLWDVESGELITTLYEHTGWVESVTFNYNGTLLASGSDDDTVRIWDLRSEDPPHILRDDMADVIDVLFSPDSRLLVAASADGRVRIWDAASGVLLTYLEGHTGGVTSLAFRSDGTLLASGGEDGTVRLWGVP